jgi:demethylmenaquinone methyltransferase/2-methoxy-6-polyprenyl-1,4-benzoquinol methylase
MRKALNHSRLREIYARVAGHYDFQHALLTARSDQRGRRLVVDETVKPGDTILDCGAGTGSTALLAAKRAGSQGKVTLFDMSEDMLTVARKKASATGVLRQCRFMIGDMHELPFADDSFDTALSTYSMCPLYDPAKGALELYRVVRPGGMIGVAHSTDPGNAVLKWLAEKVEAAVWRMPSISLGCRSVTILPTMLEAGGRVTFQRRIGIPLWPFLVTVVAKPE